MNKPTKIIIHCADTTNGRHFGVEDIDAWHYKERGFKRSEEARTKGRPNLMGIGYHYVIYIDGSIHQGRNEDEQGAHCQGENDKSIGVCLIGRNKFTQAQWDTLKAFCITKGLPCFGHFEFDSAKAQGKTCPNFNVQLWVAQGMNPDGANIINM